MCCSQLHRKGEEHDNAFSLKIVCHAKLLAIHVGILQRLSISSDCYTVDGDEYFATRALSIYLCLEQGCMSLLDIFCILWRGAVHGFFLQKRFDVGFEDDPILNEPLEKDSKASRGDSTIGSPGRLKEVFNNIGKPVFFSTSRSKEYKALF